jgi:hypothetical protein
MAQYKYLPIYKVTYDLLYLIQTKTKTFPRDFKYSLGDKLRTECIDLVIFIYKANSVQNKTVHLEQLMEKLQVVNLLCRLIKDLHLINIQSFSEIVTLTDSIQRQALGWKKYSNNLRAE